MAGAGYKLFATGDVLTAAQVNTYLMQQTVMVFASSAARTSALSGVLAEGMVSYLQDSNTLEVYDGAAWVGATGDITGLTAGTGISISSATGPVPTVTNSMATEITAKGDLIVGTGSGTFDNLAAGSNGDTIVADSSTSTGLRYTAGTVQSNPVLNSAMQVWQRGTTFASSGSAAIYTADRWKFLRAGYGTGATVSRQTTSDSTNLPFVQYAARVQRDSGTTATNGIYLYQNFESINSIPFAGKTVTMSFYARAGANYSSTSSALNVQLITGTGTDQDALLSYTGSVSVISSTATLTTTWQRFTYTATLGATITEIGTAFYNTPVGTAGAADFFEITGVQLDIGSVALPFRTYAGTIQGETSACQRYFMKFTNTEYEYFCTGANRNTTTNDATLPLPVTMRTEPTQGYSAANTFMLYIAGTITTCTNINPDDSTNQAIGIVTNVASGLTTQGASNLRANNTTATIELSAEL
jgi:hypothetical protein